MDDPIQAVEFLKQLEKKNNEIVKDNQKIVSLDVQRNQAREALRAMEKSDADKTFLLLGPMFVKMHKTQAESILKKGMQFLLKIFLTSNFSDCENADIEINKIRSDLKVKVNELRDMKRLPGIPGLSLKPLNENEMKALGVRK